MKTAGSRFLNKSDLKPLFLSLSALGASNAPLPRRKQGHPSPLPESHRISSAFCFSRCLIQREGRAGLGLGCRISPISLHPKDISEGTSQLAHGLG